MGARLVTENAYKLTDDISKYKGVIDDIIKNGDPKGLKTESIINDMLKNNPDFKIYNGKYGSNNGIDHLVENIKTGEIWVIDSKQIGKAKTFEAGAMNVIESAAKDTRQLSDEWIEAVASNLPEKEKNMLKIANKKQKIRTAVAGVNKETGDILFLPITIIDKK